MRTPRADARRPGGGPLATSALTAAALAVAMAAPAAAGAQAGGSAAGEGSAVTVAVLLAGAGVLFLAAGALGYTRPLARRRGTAAAGGTAALLTRTSGRDPDRGDGEWGLPRTPSSQGEPPPPPEQSASPAPRRAPRFARLPVFTRPPSGARQGGPTHSGQGRALGYTTFPDRRRAVSPESRYEARRIRTACEARGMVLHKLVGDVQSYSGPDLDRPGLQHAMGLLEAGEAGCLVVVGLDRLSRSAANLGTLIEGLERFGARLIVIDIDLDTDTDEGRMAARTLIRVGALERRSSEGAEPAAARRGGSSGRPAVADLPLLQRRIATMRASGMTLQAIADTLNREGVPTLRGGAEWRPSSVQAATGYRRPSQQPRREDQP